MSDILPVLMYHSIGPIPAGSRRRSIFVGERAFERQMALLARRGYRGVTMDEAHAVLQRGAPTREKLCALTFDDGFLDNVTVALPILRRHGHRATCYAVSERIGQRNRWSEDVLGVSSPLADEGALREWIDAGMELGAHTRTHARLTTLDDARLEDEVGGGKRALEDRFGLRVSQFCYPWGAHDDRVVDAVRAAGFAGATTIERGRARMGVDPLRVPRVHVLNQHHLLQFWLKLETRYGDRR
ncbi:polysaccharide deacetylase family protein [Pseudoxanthomonas sp.]|uniref:polysaccharide deacetylase family protein n=1 Tax=Pseudoxanthomonas sp. TaxID=1871049 RepID=UPI003F7D6941